MQLLISTTTVCMCVAYGWSSSSNSELAGQEVVEEGVHVGIGVVPG